MGTEEKHLDFFFRGKTNLTSKCFIKNRNFNKIPGVDVLWKRTVSAEFRAIRSKLWGKCAFL